MGKKLRFEVQHTVVVTLEMDEKLFKEGVEDKERNQYGFQSVEDVAVHLAYNVSKNNAQLSNLDGWADLKDDQLTVVEHLWLDGHAERVPKTRRTR